MVPRPRCRMLALIGSGETSPTMVTVHRDLLSRLDQRGPRALGGLHELGGLHALLLSTPYAFQENAASVSARAERYFAQSVGLQVHVTPGTSRNVDPAMAPPMTGEAGEAGAQEREAAGIAAADWVFAGPGSPSYALAHWRAGPVAAALRERVVARDGLTVLASAAAATAGRFTVPVYEVYKAGGAPHWLPGLDLLGELGLNVAVIPHYDNAEGGHYDTRHCYLGARRLAIMERELPADAAILGVDEHTAVLIDLRTEGIEVRGRGGLTVRRGGRSISLPARTSISVAELRGLVAGVGPAGSGSAAEPEDGWGRAGEGAGRENGAGGEGELPLAEVMAGAERGFGVAAGERDAGAMAGAILGLESAIERWDADTDEDQGTEQARALLRSLIARLGQAAQGGLTDPRDRLRPAVEPLLELRDTLRGQGNFAAADTIRQALAKAGLEISDTPDGPAWEPAEPAQPPSSPGAGRRR